MTFNLKKVCSSCTEETIKSYRRSILRLLNLDRQTPSQEIPKTASWLSAKTLYEKYKKLPLEKRRALSIGAVKAGQSYGLKENTTWYNLMLKDAADYKKKRSKQTKSAVEKKNWLEGGLKELKRASTEMKREIRRLLTENTLKSLYAYSSYIILRFYSELALRNDLAEIEIGTGVNHLSKKKGIFKLNLTKFKVSDKVGPVEIPLSRALSTVLSKYIKYRKQFELNHKFLVVGSSGQKLSKKALGIILQKLSKKYTGKSVGTRQLRVQHATEHRGIIEKALKISKEMLHSQMQTTKSYARK